MVGKGGPGHNFAHLAKNSLLIEWTENFKNIRQIYKQIFFQQDKYKTIIQHI